MKLENQVCSLELSKKLKELGVKQESLFYWVIGCEQFCTEDKPSIINSEFHDIITEEWGDCHSYKKEEIYSAFTFAELGRILPKEIKSDDKFHPYQLNCKWELHYSDIYMWHITYIKYPNDKILDYLIYDKNEANARAKMLIYLIKNGLVKVDDINYVKR
jgi:hypothetical protein